MTNDELEYVGEISDPIANYLQIVAGGRICQSAGLLIHIAKRHPECVKYIPLFPEIISHPDYIGRNPKEPDGSFELVKIYDDNMQIGIKMDLAQGYYYVATLHTITDAKLEHRVKSGRLGYIDN